MNSDNFIPGLTDRELVDALFSRVQLLEGRLSAQRNLIGVLATACGMADNNDARERWLELHSDSMAKFTAPHPGQELHRHANANRKTGYEGEHRQLLYVTGVTKSP